METPAELTTVILTRNEEARIGRCVSSAAFSKKIVIIDSFSTDATLERAAAAWAETGRAPEDMICVARSWLGFQKTRDLSRMEWAQTKWIFWLDADEWVSPELASSIRTVVASPAAEHSVYRMPRLSYFLGRPIRHGGWYPDRKARLGVASQSAWVLGPRGADVHEDLVPVPNGQTGLLTGHIFHEPFMSVQEQRDTNRRYSALIARGIADQRKSQQRPAMSRLRIGVKVGVKFLENYIFKLGLLDGQPGFLIAAGSAQSLYWRLTTVNSILAKPELSGQVGSND